VLLFFCKFRFRFERKGDLTREACFNRCRRQPRSGRPPPVRIWLSAQKP